MTIKKKNNDVGIIFQRQNRDRILPVTFMLAEIFLIIIGFSFEFRWKHMINSMRVIQGTALSHLMFVKRMLSAELGDFCDLVVTCGSITAAVVILCYSVLDCSRMGISNRTVIRYRIGNLTLPLIFLTSVVRLPILKILCYLKWNYILALELCWALFTQFLIIGFVIWSSSMNATIRAVHKQEIWQYKKQFAIKEADRKYLSAWKVNHLQYALQSPELFSDKARLLQKVLKVPMEVRLKKSVIDRQDNQRDNQFLIVIESVYTYYFENIYSACDALRSNVDERQKLYTFLYDAVRKIIDIDLKGTESRYFNGLTNEDGVCFIISGILNAILMSNVPEAEKVCVYILRECCSAMSSKRKNRQIMYYFLMLELRYRIGENGSNIQYWQQVCDLFEKDDWEWLDTMCYEYWKILVRQTTFRGESSARMFYDAIITLKGQSYASALMVSIRMYMKGKIEG